MISKFTCRNKAQLGFVGVVFLAIALIGIIIAGIAVMSRGSSSSTSTEANKMLAAQVIKKIDDLKNIQIIHEHDLMQDESDEGIERFTALFFSTAIDERAFDLPEEGSYLPVIVGQGRHHRFPGISYTDGVESLAVVVPYVKRDVCLQINSLLHKDSLSLEPASSNLSYKNLSGTSDVEKVSIANFNNRSDNCVFSEQDKNYVYYSIFETHSLPPVF